MPEEFRPFLSPAPFVAVLGSLAAAAVAPIGCGGDDLTAGPPPSPPGAAYRIDYATRMGGSGEEEMREPVLLSGGRLLVGARTRSTNAPVRAGAFQPSYGGGAGDAHLAIISADGSQFEAATYFGGSGMERTPYGIAVAAGGDVVFTTGTQSSNIPTSASSYRPDIHSPLPSPGDGFVCRLSGDLSTLRWCSYTGGWPRGGLHMDSQENVIVTGDRTFGSFQITPGAYQSPGTSSFTLKLNPNGTDAIFAAGIGGMSVRVRPSGDLSIVGIVGTAEPSFPRTSGAAQTTSSGLPDAFAAVLTADGSGLVYSTLLGGSARELGEHPHVVLSAGSVLFAGVTQSADLHGAAGSPAGQEEGFLAKLDPSGSAFTWVRYVGGSDDDLLLGPVVDSEGNIYMYGHTSSRDFPVTPDAIQPTYQGGIRDGVLIVLSPDGSQVRFATYLGGSGAELVRGIALGPSGELYLVGFTDSPNFPVTAGAAQTQPGGASDGFVMKLVPTGN